MLRSWNLNLIVKKSSGLPVYLQIAQQIIDEIQRCRLPPSTVMPGSRELAELINVNRKTVVLAYDELIAQGWLTSESRRGTFVSSNLPDVTNKASHPSKQVSVIQSHKTIPYADQFISESGTLSSNIIDFNDGIPDTRLIPFKIISMAFRHAILASARANKLGYDSPKGMLALRNSVATMLNMERGLNVETENICIVRGSQMGIFLAARILSKNKDCIVVENLSYPPALEAFKSCGAKILNVGQDNYGINVDELKILCMKNCVSAVYVTPHHQFPTTVMMSAERRLKLLMLAEQFDFTIIEDDYDHEFHFQHHPVLPLASTNHNGRVIYIGSLSKVLAPGLRVGYLVASREFIDHCASEVVLIDRQGNSVTELAVAELMESGEIKRHIRRSLKIYNERRNSLINLLQQELHEFVEFEPPNGGLAIWLRLKSGIDINQLVQKAQQEKVKILPASLFTQSNAETNGIRLGFGSLNVSELTTGIQRLKSAFQSQQLLTHANSATTKRIYRRKPEIIR